MVYDLHHLKWSSTSCRFVELFRITVLRNYHVSLSTASYVDQSIQKQRLTTAPHSTHPSGSKYVKSPGHSLEKSLASKPSRAQTSSIPQTLPPASATPPRPPSNPKRSRSSQAGSGARVSKAWRPTAAIPRRSPFALRGRCSGCRYRGSGIGWLGNPGRGRAGRRILGIRCRGS